MNDTPLKHKAAVFCLLWLAFLYIPASPCLADITVVREMVIAPKGAKAAANIGAVNSSPNVRLDKASIDITVGPPFQKAENKPLPVVVRATFLLVNRSDSELKLTVGFPVSNSEYSSYELEAFHVVTDGEAREVFRRTGSYPRRLAHEYISGELGPGSAKPPADIDKKSVHLFGAQHMGADTFQNLMVWEETFAPGQKKKVQVEYELTIPLQEARVLRQKAKGNYKGTWPREANNVPPDFVETLPSGSYYFFDYYLTSGASWAGPIGFEEILLRFDQWWYDVEFYSTMEPARFGWAERKNSPSDPAWMYYTLENVDPAENIYFAVKHRSIEDELSGRPGGHMKNIIREPGPDNTSLSEEKEGK